MTGQDERKVVAKRDGFGGGQMVLAFVGGAVAGAIGGLLLAPRSGVETRAKLRDLADRAKEKAAQLPEAFHEAASAAKIAFAEGMEEVPHASHGPNHRQRS